jgi:hypothetical protein
MAWNQVTVMEQKHQFVSLAATGRFTFTELCADFHVSRKGQSEDVTPCWLDFIFSRKTNGVAPPSRP